LIEKDAFREAQFLEFIGNAMITKRVTDGVIVLMWHLCLSFSLPPHCLFGPCMECDDGTGMENPGNLLEGRAGRCCVSRDQ
jgi:hypothetical protein